MKDEHSNYNRWQTPVGQDCKDLKCTLAKWLGERLLFLSQEPKGVTEHWCTDLDDFDERGKAWTEALRTHGQALIEFERHGSDWPDPSRATDSAIERKRVLESWSSKQNERFEQAQAAIRFAADNLDLLWD
jgi:hypothetical protein